MLRSLVLFALLQYTSASSQKTYLLTPLGPGKDQTLWTFALITLFFMVLFIAKV